MSRPSARVYIQIRETGEVFELEDFMSVDTDLNIFSTSTASIEVVNNLDKWYTFFYQPDQQTPSDTGITPLLLNVHQSPKFKDVNQKLAALTTQLYNLPKGTNAEKTIKQNALSQIVLINEYLVFDLMYRVWIDFRGREDLYDLDNPPPEGNLPEYWYAGFTGIIASVDEGFSAGKIEKITLNCKDMRRFFEITQAVTNKGYDPIWNDVASKLATMQAYTNNFSAYLDGAAVVLFLTDLVNKIFHPGLTDSGESQGLYSNDFDLGNNAFWALPPLQENTDVVQSIQNSAASAQADVNSKSATAASDQQNAAANPNNQQSQKQAEDSAAALAIAQSNFQSAQNAATNARTGVGKSSVIRNYQDALDITPIRDPSGFAGMTKTSTFLSENQFEPPAISGLTANNFNKSDLVNYISKDNLDKVSDQSLITDYTISKFEVDKLVSAGGGGISTNPYQTLISNGVFGFENQRTPASSIISMLANYMGYNIWFDAKGNLIYQTAHYDDFPNAQTDGDDDYDDPEASRGIPFIGTGYDSNGKVVGHYGDQYASQLFKKDIGPVGLPFHGRNYIIGDESVLGWSVSQDESDVLTALAVQSNPQLINPGDVPDLLKKILATSLYTDPDLLRKFGPRYEIAPPLITSELGGQQLLNTLADGLLRRRNHNLENLTLSLNCRPDLQLGRTLYFAERRKLYYITRIQQHYVQGQSLDTVISGQYGHLATDPIGDPISIAINGGIYSNVSPNVSIVDTVTAAENKQPDLDKMS